MHLMGEKPRPKKLTNPFYEFFPTHITRLGSKALNLKWSSSHYPPFYEATTTTTILRLLLQFNSIVNGNPIPGHKQKGIVKYSENRSRF